MNAAEILRAASYAAWMHREQRRKGAGDVPYINHVLDVARRVALSAHGEDPLLIVAALLHDVVEDTEGEEAEIREMFGGEVAALVMEVTDDKSLPKAERKRLQVAKIAGKSDRAKRLKLADKASNITAIADAPPDWPLQRKLDYLQWAEDVVAGCRGVDPALEEHFDRALAHARDKVGGDM